MHEEPTSQKHKRQNTLTLLTGGHERDLYFSNSAERHYLPQSSTANTLTPPHHGIFYQYFKMYGVLYNIITYIQPEIWGESGTLQEENSQFPSHGDEIDPAVIRNIST